LILALAIEEFSVKTRSGPPADDEADYELPIWAGVIPLTTTSGEPEPDPRLADGIEIPESVARLLSHRVTESSQRGVLGA